MKKIDYKKIANDYARHRRVHPGVLEELSSACEPGARALEIGCGTGNYIVALCAAAGVLGWGADPSEEMLAEAKKKSDTVTFFRAAAEELEFTADYFDLAFSVDVVHHLSSALDYLVRAHRVLKRGARLCTVTDSEWIIKNRLMSGYFPETVDPELRRYPAIATLRVDMKAAGFRNLVEKTVEYAYDLTDIQPYRDKAFSALHLIPEPAFEKGVQRMAADLEKGPVPAVSRYLMVWGEK